MGCGKNAFLLLALTRSTPYFGTSTLRRRKSTLNFFQRCLAFHDQPNGVLLQCSHLVSGHLFFDCLRVHPLGYNFLHSVGHFQNFIGGRTSVKRNAVTVFAQFFN